MNFEEFKKRYVAKLMKSGLYVPEDLDNDAEFNDRMAEIYLGLMVYAEFQNEYAKAAYEKSQAEALIKAKKQAKKIYVPNKEIIQ